MEMRRRRSSWMAVVLCALVVVLVPVQVAQHSADAATAERYAPSDPRRSMDLDRSWRFHLGEQAGAQEPGFDDSAWQAVTVPHTWNAQDGQDGGGDYVRGEGWYRRHLVVPAALEGRQLFLQFDGANQVTDVWLNGRHLGQHRGGYARFRFDATDAARVGGDNVIAVRVSNVHDADVAPLSGDYTFFGGMYRSVSLQAVDPVHVDMLDYAGPGVYLQRREMSTESASVTVTTKLASAAPDARAVRVRSVITSADGRIVREVTSAPVPLPPGGRSSAESTVVLDSPRLWHGHADPYLYRATVEVRDDRTGRLLDVVTQPLGLRAARIDANTGFHLNGQKLQLRGVNRHQDVQDKGWALSAADHERDFALMREMGVNALRTAHYQQDELVYELADRLGFVVYTEIPWLNEMTDSAAFRDNVKQQLREMIRQTYNHPSVLFWGIGNELGWLQRDKDLQLNLLLAELARIVRAEDPQRFSGFANMFLRLDEDPMTWHADASGYNRYEGWYVGTTDLFGVWADALHARNPGRRIGLTEYGAGASIHQHEEPQPEPPEHDGPWHPEEYQALFHEEYLKQIDARPYLWGTFVWNMFDFASDGRNEGDRPGINDKGLVTHDRAVKKDAFYWYKANWGDEPVTYITSRRWTTRTEAATTVKVYATADTVRLTLNGAEIGTRTSGDHIFTWPVRLQPGKNTITAESVIDGGPHTDTVTWNLAP